jgi:hypothetical protein
MIADAPKNGWLLYAPATGEHMIVSGSLESLGRCAEGVWARTHEKFPDACVIHCFELGRKMSFSLRSVVASLEPLEGET